MKPNDELNRNTWIIVAVWIAIIAIIIIAPRSTHRSEPPPPAPAIAEALPRPIDLRPAPVIEPEQAVEPPSDAAPPPEPASPPAEKRARIAKAKVVEPPPEPAIPEPVPVEAVEIAKDAEEPPAEEPVPEEPKRPSDEERLAELLKPMNTVEIVFTEGLGGLRTNQLLLMIDGREFARSDSSAALPTASGYTLYRGELPVGRHEVVLRARMTGDAKMFNYVDHYTFTIMHKGTLLFAPGTTRLSFEVIRKGDITVPWDKRVDLEVVLSSEPPGEA